VSECCDCKDEIFVILVGRVAADDLSLAEGSSGLPLGDTHLMRGSPAVPDFNTTREIECVVHSDWCEHRPTKAAAEIVHDTEAPNGTIRVFVEAARDFSKYVFSEIEYRANVAFPVLDDRWHYADQAALEDNEWVQVPVDRPVQGGPYQEQQLPNTNFFSAQPIFGTATGGFVYTPLDQQDGGNYATSPWPLTQPQFLGPPAGAFGGPPKYHVLDDRYRGTKLLVRWGHRHDDEDTVLGEVSYLDHYGSVLRTSGPPFFLGLGPVAFVGIGCNWDDIASATPDETVRCGVEMYAPENLLGLPNRVSTVSVFGFFSQSFDLPRSFFVDSDADSATSPPLPYQLVGMSRTSPTAQVPVGITIEAGQVVAEIDDSTILTARTFVSTVTCGAERANVLIFPEQQDGSDVLPPAVIGPAEPPPLDGIKRPVSESEPFVVRRPDLVNLSERHVANADSWHASHLVRLGSPLASLNALHNLHLEIVEAERPADTTDVPSENSLNVIGRPLFVTPTAMPAVMRWFGQHNYVRRTNFEWEFGPVEGSDVYGPMFTPTFLNDVLNDNDGNPLPPLWAWNAMAGEHTLEPFGPEEEDETESETRPRLVPNAYHVFYGDAFRTIENDIVTPDAEDIDFPQAIGPLTEEEFGQYEELEHPALKNDYRVEWTIETFPQLWARTSLGGLSGPSFLRVGPLDVPVENSGMTSERYDGFSLESSRWDYVPDDVGATITIHSRINLKISITRVRGFRRQRQQVDDSNFWEPTAGVAVYGDHDCDDVAYFEKLFVWKIPLSAADVAALSDGEEVAKQLLAGSYLAPPAPEMENDIEVDRFRTVRIRVSKVGEEE
jgi:hypothetical protein